MTNQYKKFEPDLIVEVTRVCDRSCPGCYAPNVISHDLPFDLYEKSPELFLQPDIFQKSLQSAALKGVRSIAFRGGEPSKHPFLYQLLRIAHSVVDEVFIETHGRWIEAPFGYFGLMSVSAELGSYVKLSYDKMHGLSSLDLFNILDVLEQKKIKWLIAITEATEAQFLEKRSTCSWAPDEKIIFQRKASLQSDLIKPAFGIMSVSGNLSTALTVKQEFEPVQTMQAAI